MLGKNNPSPAITWRLPVCVALTLLTVTAGLCAGEGVVTRSNPESYRMRVGMTMRSGKFKPTTLAVALPLAESSAYQDVELLNAPPGKVHVIPETGDKYLMVKYSRKELEANLELTPSCEYRVTLYDIHTDFSQIRSTESYRKDDEYRRYTSASKDYIDPNHPDIVAIARSLAVEARDHVDFARRAYEYVAKQYRHRNITGFRPLSETLRAGGGHCGDMSAIYISILRNAGIPARHLAGHLNTGKTHIISEFYIEDCGWIPVDVDSRSTKPGKDFFGNIPKDSMPIVLSRDMHLTLERLSGAPVKVAGLQRGWTFWEPKKAKVQRNFTVHCEKAY